MSLLSFLLYIIIIIMCTHICSLANACSHSLVSAFSHSMSAHMRAVWSAHSCTAWSAHICSVWSAYICPAWPAHIRTSWSVHSLSCAYSRSLVSAQLACQCVFAVWSAHSLVNAFSRSLVSVVAVISVCNIRWPFFSKEAFCSSECVEFWQAINIIILNAKTMRKIGLIFPKVTVKENSLNCSFFLSVICSCFACSICRKTMTHIGCLIHLVKLISL